MADVCVSRAVLNFRATTQNTLSCFSFGKTKNHQSDGCSEYALVVLDELESRTNACSVRCVAAVSAHSTTATVRLNTVERCTAAAAAARRVFLVVCVERAKAHETPTGKPTHTTCVVIPPSPTFFPWLAVLFELRLVAAAWPCTEVLRTGGSS